MSAAWLILQIGFAGAVEPFAEYSISAFFKSGAPKSMKKYQDCVVDGVIGLGFLFTALWVYVVGEVSEAGGGKNWFQFTLNQSRLDQYYWVLTTLCSLNLIAYIFMACDNCIRVKQALLEERHEYFSGGGFRQRFEENGTELRCIKKGSALELVLRYYK
ncbi:hypothetical protein SASPL_137962 [Salvia splendens]|uniref:Uncharacterized protein n=1 Tax=Salvia splendens TaxID=180675 RepID=A0A8X8ZDW2_SALSN|nr:hypothetical protein SASPL_137962 [Salvia splendens]